MGKTEIEKIIDAVESKERIKKQGEKLIPKYKLEGFKERVEESTYEKYHLKEMELLLKLQYGLKRGLSMKDALYISKHKYKDVPIDVTSSLLCEYTSYGPYFIEANRFDERKKRIVLQKK